MAPAPQPARPVYKVVHSTSDWLPLTQTWMHAQVRSLPAERIEAHVVCRRALNLDQFLVPHLHALERCPAPQRWWEAAARRAMRYSPFLVRTARRIGAELVHSHFGPGGWRDLPSLRRLKARHVVTFYGFDVSQLPRLNPVWRERYAELFASVDKVLCEGPFMAGSIINDLGCPAHKLHVHHLGVDTGSIAYRPRRWTPGTPLRVLVAATFVEKKGIPDAMRALARIRDVVPIEVTLIGEAQDNARSQREKQAILAAIDEAGLGGRVRRLGFQPHARLVEEAYRNHVFLSPSVTASDGDCEGGVPVTIIEMAASGMPVVSTRHCDIPMVIEPGRTGLLAEEHDVDGLAGHLRWLVESPESWQPMLDRARRHIEQEFDAGLQGLRLADAYAGLIEAAQPRAGDRRR